MTTAATDFGDLYDYSTGDAIRPATRDELARSLAAGQEGAFDLDGRTVYVEGESEEAREALEG